eukprot:gene8413-10855_t
MIEVADYFGGSNVTDLAHNLGNRSDHINKQHYGSPLDCSTCSPPINCKLDEDGLIIDSFICNMTTNPPDCQQSLVMWCAPNLTRSGSIGCPLDVPPGATTEGAKPKSSKSFDQTGSTSCYLSCKQNSDCGDKAVCVNETSSIGDYMCTYALA